MRGPAPARDDPPPQRMVEVRVSRDLDGVIYEAKKTPRSCHEAGLTGTAQLSLWGEPCWQCTRGREPSPGTEAPQLDGNVPLAGAGLPMAARRLGVSVGGPA